MADLPVPENPAGPDLPARPDLPAGPQGPVPPERPEPPGHGAARPGRSAPPLDLAALAAEAWSLVADDAARSAAPDGVTGAVPSRRLLGIAGAPGAGKSTLARALVAAVRERHGAGSAAYLPLDGFHLSNAQLRRLGLTDRKGSEPSFDVWGYAALLDRVRREGRREIYVPDYDRTLHEPVAARHLVPPSARLVITEGNYLACDAPGWRAARASLAEVWYLETADAVREHRLVERQLAGGRDAEQARAWVVGNDQPNGEQVKESRRRCDRVLVPLDMDMFSWQG
ncbi:nucleoside/nucleotide kinase family protein [Streptomyces buecherae]|uniref:nucleoside/nucleotide kinase family protein n=1 Tax=Streptomyces buecherae TaxID=2763006 RepID=UPI00378DF390